MPKSLIIVESPAKVKTIRKFLGPDYLVEASVGHVRDLPSNTLGVDEQNGFAPKYEIIPGKEKVVNELQSAAKKVDTVYLAPDPDREGEAIAWHVAELLKGKAKKIQRIQFNEITRRAVLEALEHPREVDDNLVHAQQARRILDRLVGYKISPLLWRTVKRGISAGRVQSVALRLIVDREKEREAFRPDEFWVFHAFAQAGEQEFRLELAKVAGKKAVIANEEEAKALEKRLEGQPFVVTSVESRERSREPQPPFTTSTLQQTANQRLSYGARRTMGIAQSLYEGIEMGDGNVTALITYMRTDSTRISDEAKKAAKEFILESFGKNYLPARARAYKTRATAQDAHEAIRPVDVALTPEDVKASLTQEQYNLYRLIWSRFVASQMASAVFRDTSVVVHCANTQWQTKCQCQIFDGWQKVLRGEKDNILPALTVDEQLDIARVEKEQKFTQPPARFTEASLVRTLEELGIGRPSTYATIISTLEDRGYVDKKEKSFVPTELGRVVTEQLLESFAHLMDVHFTANMETGLDKVADGEEGWGELLGHFADDFNPTLAEASKNMKSLKAGMQTELVCPECSKPLLVRFGKAGAFLACSDYPDCTYSSNFTRDDQGHIHIAPVEREVVGTCPDCGGELVVKKARTGSRFIACSSYPDCRHAEPFSTHVTCPACGKGELVEKSSRRGKIFYSCSTYPKCDYATWNEPVAKKCPECGGSYLEIRKTRQGESIVCPNKECDFSCALADVESLQPSDAPANRESA